MEIDYQRIVVDDEAVVVEFKQCKILSGQNFTSGAYADTLRASGETADVGAYYLTQGRVTVIVPFDEQCRMMGEDAYSSGATTMRKLADDELPDSFRARFAV
jgi:hypothetical protein